MTVAEIMNEIDKLNSPQLGMVRNHVAKLVAENEKRLKIERSRELVLVLGIKHTNVEWLDQYPTSKPLSIVEFAEMIFKKGTFKKYLEWKGRIHNIYEVKGGCHDSDIFAEDVPPKVIEAANAELITDGIGG